MASEAVTEVIVTEAIDSGEETMTEDLEMVVIDPKVASIVKNKDILLEIVLNVIIINKFSPSI